MTKQYLADIKRKLYDPRAFKNFKDAVRINMAIQITTDNINIVPLTEKVIKKLKLKEEKLF